MSSNVTLSMNKFVTPSTSNNVTQSMSKSATQCLREFANLLSQAMPEDLVVVEVAAMVVLVMAMDSLLLPLAEMFQNKNVKVSQDNNVKMFLNRSATVSHVSNVTMFQDRSAKLFQDKSPDRNVGMFQVNNVIMHQWRNVPMSQDKCQGKSARPSQWSNVTLFQESNVRASLKRFAKLQVGKDVSTLQDKFVATFRPKLAETAQGKSPVRNAQL